MPASDGFAESDLFCNADFERLLAELTEATGDLQSDEAWPLAQFQKLATAGVLGWVIPREWGGSDVTIAELICGYEKLSQACLVTAFVLTQRNGACQRIAGADNDDVKRELLPGLCRGETFATVGISHLTTSRQHLSKPSVRVAVSGDRYVFDGIVPWVTGARHADFVVTGGTLDDGRQVLAVVPMANSNVVVEQSARLMALNASQTGAVRLNGVEIDESFVIAGPVEQVMKQGRGGGTGSVTTSALAIGAAAASLQRLQAEAKNRPDLIPIHESLANEQQAIADDLHAAVDGASSEGNPMLSAESIRQRANSLVLRASQAYLAASKGAGFVAGHPAGRAVCEALFFLVWSCPQPVLAAALREFACVIDD